MFSHETKLFASRHFLKGTAFVFVWLVNERRCGNAWVLHLLHRPEAVHTEIDSKQIQFIPCMFLYHRLKEIFKTCQHK